jgi:probable rRNA maturation factor
LDLKFCYHNIKFRLKEARRTRIWLIDTANRLGFERGSIEIQFVSRAKILELNRKYLNHHFITDILTFTYKAGEGELIAELYICPWQVKRNAHSFQEYFSDEVRRVLVHGILHCGGYHDLTNAEIRAMREAENLYLGNF